MPPEREPGVPVDAVGGIFAGVMPVGLEAVFHFPAGTLEVVLLQEELPEGGVEVNLSFHRRHRLLPEKR